MKYKDKKRIEQAEEQYKNGTLVNQLYGICDCYSSKNGNIGCNEVNKDCYYKQLQACQEQENTALKQQIDIYKSMFEEIETLNKNHPFCQGKAFKEIVLETMEEAKQALEEG